MGIYPIVITGPPRMTPAMVLGVTDHIWTIGELIEAATTGELPNSKRVGRFTVIDGGCN